MARRRVLRGSGTKRRAGSSSFVLVLIGVFKIIKALLLITAGVGAFQLLHRDAAATLIHWTRVLRIDPDNRMAHEILAKIFQVSPRRLKELEVGTFLYAGLFSIEGAGLLLRKRWAEYFTIVTTGGLIPLEALEVTRHASLAKGAVLLVNVLIVVYLVKRVRSAR